MRTLHSEDFASYARAQITAAEQILAGHRRGSGGLCCCGRLWPCPVAQACTRTRDHYRAGLALLEQTIALPAVTAVEPAPLGVAAAAREDPRKRWWAMMSATFIAVEGPTGVGKTTLATRLASVLDATLTLDPFKENPFLPQLLRGAPGQDGELALRVELTFLALRVAQLRRIEGMLAAGRKVVADWALLKQPIFAATTLDPADAARVAATVQLWAEGLPAPDVLIGMSAPTTVLRRRVRHRGRRLEAELAEAQLTALSAAFEDAYEKWDRPLIRLDTATFDAFSNQDLHELANQISRLPTPLESQ